MRPFVYAVCWALPWLSALSCHGAAGDEAPVDRLARWLQRVQNPSPRLSSRDLFSFVLEAAAHDWRTDAVERALELAEQMQDRDPASRTYGNFKWYWESEKPVDRNAVEFCMQQGVLVWSLFRDRLTPQAVDRLKRLIEYSIEGILRHRVSVTYTNIFLMKTWNLIAIGEATGRSDLAELGYQMLNQWILHTAQNGIHEYVSPTYYGVDLDSLGLIARFAQRSSGRRAAEAALELLWTDIAANWFPPGARLGGAHSRDYDYLTGHGYLDRHLRLAGWLEGTSAESITTFEKLCHWMPPKKLRAIFERQVPRLVQQRWGGEAGQYATHYVGQGMSIGSAGANYGPMDKVLVVNFAGGPQTPVLNFFMDGRNDPYGRKKVAQGRSGHFKALHLTPFVASAQRGRDVILLAAADMTDPASWRHGAEPTCLLSHVVFPEQAEVWFGEEKTARSKDAQRLTVPRNQPVFLRMGDVAVGIRWLLVRTVEQEEATIELIRDGAQYRAQRMTCVHSLRRSPGLGVVALWLRADEGLDDAAFAAFRKRFASIPVTTRFSLDDTQICASVRQNCLRLRVDLKARKLIAAEGVDPGTGSYILAVNGRDLGREILEKVDCVARYRHSLQAAQTGAPDALRCGEVIEAEAAHFLTPPFQIDGDQAASGRKFLWVPGKAGSPGAGSAAQARWFVHVPTEGRYYMWGRVRTPSPADDSFYVQISQGGRTVLAKTDWHTGVHKKWEWSPLRLTKDHVIPDIELEKGAVEIRLFGREDGAAIDAFVLTTDPTWRPEERALSRKDQAPSAADN